MHVIMLSGYLQSGKDTVGRILCDNHGYTRVAFADVLKDEVSRLYSINRGFLDTQEGKATKLENGKTTRDLLIEHGQMKRRENIDHWVLQVIENVRDKGLHKVVITDWRFPNEFHSVKRELGENIEGWRINRWKVPPLNDITEVSLDDFCFDKTIDNSGPLENLDHIVSNLVPKVETKYFLTDVDDCLLLWIDGFRKFITEKGLRTRSKYPTSWNMNLWIDDRGSQLPVEKVLSLVGEFNRSLQFGDLLPDPEALESLKWIKQQGYEIIAISSCINEEKVVYRRKLNLEKHFPGLISKVICLDLGENKRQVLCNFPKSFFIDDNVDNVLAGKDIGHDCFLIKRTWNEQDGMIHSLPILDSWKNLATFINMTFCN